jgi:hypothetical protein
MERVGLLVETLRVIWLPSHASIAAGFVAGTVGRFV